MMLEKPQVDLYQQHDNQGTQNQFQAMKTPDPNQAFTSLPLLRNISFGECQFLSEGKNPDGQEQRNFLFQDENLDLGNILIRPRLNSGQVQTNLI